MGRLPAPCGTDNELTGGGSSNNFVRYTVCEALRQCESVLTSQMLNVDEVLRRIQSVLTSNDPVAHAITLRTLCAMPSLMADRLDVHHAIRDCWTSKHELEREAVLWAMDRYWPSSTKSSTMHLIPLQSIGPITHFCLGSSRAIGRDGAQSECCTTG